MFEIIVSSVQYYFFIIFSKNVKANLEQSKGVPIVYDNYKVYCKYGMIVMTLHLVFDIIIIVLRICKH